MKKPKHVDIMHQIQQSPYGQGRRRLPQSKWAELMRAIAEDVENDALDEEGKKRVMLAMGRAAAEMDANEQQLKAAKEEIANMRGIQRPKKEPRE
jgi:hypothetical protein